MDYLIGPVRRGRVGGWNLLVAACPEPAVDTDRLQVGPVAALEVAQPAACPDVVQLV